MKHMYLKIALLTISFYTHAAETEIAPLLEERPDIKVMEEENRHILPENTFNKRLINHLALCHADLCYCFSIDTERHATQYVENQTITLNGKVVNDLARKAYLDLQQENIQAFHNDEPHKLIESTTFGWICNLPLLGHISHLTASTPTCPVCLAMQVCSVPGCLLCCYACCEAKMEIGKQYRKQNEPSE